MNKFEVGQRIRVIYDGFSDNHRPTDYNLIGWVGTITKVYPDGDLCVDLDPEQDPYDCLEALYFGPAEVEVIQ